MTYLNAFGTLESRDKYEIALHFNANRKFKFYFAFLFRVIYFLLSGGKFIEADWVCAVVTIAANLKVGVGGILGKVVSN